MELYDWQRKDVDRLAAADYVGLLNIEPGGGKTFASASAAHESGAASVLVIAPDATHSSWTSTANGLGHEVHPLHNRNKAGKEAQALLDLGAPGWFVTTPQFFTRNYAGDWAPDFLIVDEVHQLGNPGSAGQRKLSGFNNRDKVQPISQRATHRLALSGTPARNHFERMWSVTRLLWPGAHKRNQVADELFHRWQVDRMTSRFAPYMPKGQQTVFENEAQPGRLLGELPLAINHYRRRQCCEAHPDGFLDVEEPQVLREVVNLTPAQNRLIRDAEANAIMWFEDNPYVFNLPIVAQMRIRQTLLAEPTLHELPPIREDDDMRTMVTYAPDAKSPTLDRMLELLDELDDEPVVVFTASQKFAELATNRFNAAGVTAFEYSGATTGNRTENMALFGTDFRVAVVVIAAGGTGLDGIQRVCSTEFWADRDLDMTNNIQAEARADRMGASRQVQRFIFTDDRGLADKRWINENVKKERLTASVQAG